MSNPVQQNPGYTFNGQVSGILGTATVSGTGIAASGTTTINTLNFNPQTTGPASGSLRKGSLLELSAGGHAPDILATVASATSITTLTTMSASTTGVTVRALNLPGLITGEAAATTNGNNLTSNYYTGNAGVSGVVNQTDLSNSVYADIVFIAGAAFTPTAGGYLAGWFLESEDTGFNFEKTVAGSGVPRAPDFIVPLYSAAYAAGDRAWAKGVLMPSAPFKVLFQNNSGVTMPATWGIWAVPEGVQLTT